MLGLVLIKPKKLKCLHSKNKNSISIKLSAYHCSGHHYCTTSLMLWCSDYHYYTTSFSKAWTQVLRRFRSWSRHVGDSRWWGSLTIAPAGNKAKSVSSVNHTTKTIHHHHFIVSVIHYSIRQKLFSKVYSQFSFYFMRSGKVLLVMCKILLFFSSEKHDKVLVPCNPNLGGLFWGSFWGGERG